MLVSLARVSALCARSSIIDVGLFVPRNESLIAYMSISSWDSDRLSSISSTVAPYASSSVSSPGCSDCLASPLLPPMGP